MNEHERPLAIAKQGWFFAGGTWEEGGSRRRMTGQMYVEYQIPDAVEAPCPVVMIHGGSQSGSNYTGTPDGREGWAQFFLRRGWPVYVVDTVGRGRATGAVAAHGEIRDPDFSFVEARFAAPRRAALWPQARLHTQFPGTAQAV